jgi:CMP-N-acetylneuraminic acid synthetase
VFFWGHDFGFSALMMKLQQDQVWKQDGEFLRIVRLERLAVEYKQMKDLVTREGKHFQVSKKEFCRLIKTATLLSPEEIRAAQG